MYTEGFLSSFESSDFFTSCKKTIVGKLRWNDWSHCDVSCGGGLKWQTAKECVPSYAHCYDIQIKEKPCNLETCPYVPPHNIPIGSIIPWIPRPNQDASQADTDYVNYEGWIVCNGKETCLKGSYAGEVCSDLSDRVLVGEGNERILTMNEALDPFTQQLTQIQN